MVSTLKFTPCWLKHTVEGLFEPGVGGTGFVATITDLVLVLLHEEKAVPIVILVVVINLTLKVLAEVKACVGFCKLEEFDELPGSPKSQEYVVLVFTVPGIL